MLLDLNHRPATIQIASNKRRFAKAIVSGFLLLLGGCSSPGPFPAGEAPNIIIILADDLGYADIGSYGATGFATPNLDNLAAGGMRFTNFYVASSGCSPSRAALLTGAYAQRVGIPQVLFPYAPIGLNPDEVTLADIARDKGYATAAVGKWHLGDHPKFLPLNNGFDSYFGIPYSNDMSPDPKNNPRPNASRFDPLPLIRDSTVIELEPDQSKLVPRYTEEVLSFIRTNKDNPFLLYMAHTFPHVPIYASPAFGGSSANGLYGDVIQEIDWSVGEILSELENQGIADNTLVIFTSDNGPWLIFGDHGGSAGPLREGKDTSFEGGQRVPAIVRLPGHIPAGVTSDAVVRSIDLAPTLAAILGSDLLDGTVIDGANAWPVFTGKSKQDTAEHFYFYRGNDLQAVRSGRWKLHLPHNYNSVDGGVVENGGAVGSYLSRRIELSLFDLETDIGETTDVSADHPEQVRRLLALAETARAEIGDAATGRTGAQIREPGRTAPWRPVTTSE